MGVGQLYSLKSIKEHSCNAIETCAQHRDCENRDELQKRTILINKQE
jgi:hypothetical protein